MDRKQLVQTALIVAAAIAVCAVVFGIIHHIDSKPDMKENRSESVLDPTYLYFGEKEYELKDNVKTYLILGTDGIGKKPNSKNYHGPMADYVLALIIDKTAEKYGFIQIDRDTMIDVNMIGPDGDDETCDMMEMQFCVSTWYGKDLMQGLENAVSTAESLLGGIKIDGYYAVNMKDIAKLNSAVGGVTVDIEDDFTKYDPEMKPGATLHLNDKQAELFVQSRMTIGDGTNESRMRRQKQYMESLMDESRGKMSSDKSFAMDLFEKLEPIANTNIPGNRVSAIANLLHKYDSQGVFDIEGEHTEGRVRGDSKDYVQFWHDDESLADIMKTLCGLDDGHAY